MRPYPAFMALPDSAEIVAFHGRAICVRQLQPEDRSLLEELVAQTELHDLRMRFFGGFRDLPPDLLDHLMRIDPQQRIALVAGSYRSSGTPEILAVGRAHAVARGSAELALLVRSDLKGLGLGSLLLERLIRCCRRRGVSRLEADVLHENAPMLRLAHRYGFRREAVQQEVTHLVLELSSLAA
jgi:acetyltransferase